MTAPRSHPRYQSLLIRERIEEGWKAGLVSTAGLFAHGRGEAYDYLLGEQTRPFAERAIEAAAAALLTSKRPVLSVNGNTAALSTPEVVELAALLELPIEVNIFYHSMDRLERLVAHLEAAGAEGVLGLTRDAKIPHLDQPRAHCSSEGIYSADTILVPLEDGDRTHALRKIGKRVIVIDLNPLSRSAKYASITIVDNIVRAMPRLIAVVKQLHARPKAVLAAICGTYDNRRTLEDALGGINTYLSSLQKRERAPQER